MVDTEDVLLVEDLRNDVGEFARRLKIVPEWLLDDDASPLAALALVEACVGQMLGDDGEVGRRDRQVEGVVTAGAAHAVEFSDGVGQAAVGLGVVECAGHEAQA